MKLLITGGTGLVGNGLKILLMNNMKQHFYHLKTVI